MGGRGGARIMGGRGATIVGTMPAASVDLLPARRKKFPTAERAMVHAVVTDIHNRHDIHNVYRAVYIIVALALPPIDRHFSCALRLT